jgi:cell fate regulator YaaT (PSP1 superfamily)
MAEKYVVRHGAMRHLGEFEPTPPAQYARNARVVVRSPRGLEVGEVLCEATERTHQLLSEPTQGQILRPLTPDDAREWERLQELRKKEYEVCRRFIEQRRLQMDLIEAEHLLGGDRIVFYFVVRPPEKRVDFREIVRDLAREFQTRIEMRQVGIRDEAKLLADYGDCGKPVCCNTHMTVMPPVSMRMAKLQKSTLDPSKISGRCGRLKCCLRFEQDVYEDFVAELPPVGTRVVTRKGQGKVLAQEILARKLLVEFEDRRRVIIEASEVLTRLGRGGPGASGEPPPEGGPPPERGRGPRPKGDRRGPAAPPPADDEGE